MTALSKRSLELIRATQSGMPACAEPFAAVASALGTTEQDVLSRFEDLIAAGVVRRIAAAPNHFTLGMTANGMSVWDVEDTSAYFGIAKKIALAQRTVFGTDAIQSKIVGEQVPHAHIWVFADPATAQGDKTDFAGNASKLRDTLLA